MRIAGGAFVCPQCPVFNTATTIIKCRVFTGIGTESNYIAATQRVLFELPWEGNAPVSDFPLDRKYLLKKVLT